MGFDDDIHSSSMNDGRVSAESRGGKLNLRRNHVLAYELRMRGCVASRVSSAMKAWSVTTPWRTQQHMSMNGLVSRRRGAGRIQKRPCLAPTPAPILRTLQAHKGLSSRPGKEFIQHNAFHTAYVVKEKSENRYRSLRVLS